jgi:hypothetical protein
VPQLGYNVYSRPAGHFRLLFELRAMALFFSCRVTFRQVAAAHASAYRQPNNITILAEQAMLSFHLAPLRTGFAEPKPQRNALHANLRCGWHKGHRWLSGDRMPGELPEW